MVLYLVYLGCLFCCFLFGLYNRKALESRQLSILIPYLLLVFIQELIVFIIRVTQPKPDAAIVYNFHRPVSICFFAWVYYHIPLKSSYQKAIPWILSTYLLLVTITLIFLQPIRVYSSELSLAGGFVILLFGILFLFNYFNLDNAAEENKWSPVLWITAGILIFYPVVNITFAFYDLIFDRTAKIFGVYLYNATPQILSILMYGCFAYAFYLCRQKT
jgi:hypothetical protein